MDVRKTFTHGGLTLEHGTFRVRETVRVCATGCVKGGAGGKPIIKRHTGLSELLLPRSTVGYDVMTFVGLERFVHYRQREEIRSTLTSQYGITLSTGEISALARRFLVYLEALHHARAPAIRAALVQDGGWPLHVDATGEDGQGTLLVVYAGWRGWALGAWKISTEHADAILPRLRTVAARFGNPCAVMRDLGKAVIEATRDFVAELKRPIPILGCHLHFLKDIGKDLLRSSHDELRDLFRRFKVLPHLRAQVRELGRGLGKDIDAGRKGVAKWLASASPSERIQMPEDEAGLAVVRALGQWVLDYHDDGTGAGFPFDRPSLDLFRRCHRACRAVESLLCKPSNDKRIYRALERLHRVLALVRSEVPFQRQARILETRGRLFDELRDNLRLQVKSPPSQPGSATLDKQQQLVKIRDVEKAVKAFEASLRKRRPQRGPALDMRKAIDLILSHLDRHGSSLWGHVITLPRVAGSGTRLVERTNVVLESFFHQVKHGERRRSGRKILSQDFEAMPAAAVIARNLVHADYLSVLCGTLKALPRAFAQLDAIDRSTPLPARLLAATNANTEVVTSSLPRADRIIVRADALHERVLAEARSRAPLHPVRKRRIAGSATVE